MREIEMLCSDRWNTALWPPPRYCTICVPSCCLLELYIFIQSVVHWLVGWMCVAMRKIHENLGRRALFLWWTFKLDQLLMKHLGEQILSSELNISALKKIKKKKTERLKIQITVAFFSLRRIYCLGHLRNLYKVGIIQNSLILLLSHGARREGYRNQQNHEEKLSQKQHLATMNYQQDRK